MFQTITTIAAQQVQAWQKFQMIARIAAPTNTSLVDVPNDNNDSSPTNTSLADVPNNGEDNSSKNTSLVDVPNDENVNNSVIKTLEDASNDDEITNSSSPLSSVKEQPVPDNRIKVCRGVITIDVGNTRMNNEATEKINKRETESNTEVIHKNERTEGQSPAVESVDTEVYLYIAETR